MRARSLAAAVVLMFACDTVSAPPVELRTPSFMTAAWSEWSDPVHLDAPVNTACQDQTPTLSKDELALYFTSNRRGGLGNDTPDGCQDSFDIWVARRPSRDADWETPVNLGAPVNTPDNDVSPELSPDGDLLFFARFAGAGQRDIYIARRAGNQDDDGWTTPVSLGPAVNTASDEDGPTFIRHEGDGDGTLFFYRGSPPINTDLYSVRITKDGETLGPPVVQAGLNSGVEDNHAGLRRDGREIFFNSRRPGGVPNPSGQPSFDLWVATRDNVHDAWSTPVNLGAPVNSPAAEFHPSISFDGRTLVFIDPSGAVRGGLGGFDIWMTTRTQSGN
jgi:Tol biopolymer transport system component